jgi:hypothetical protein
MLQKKFALCSATAMLALAVACSQSPQSPASPAGTPPVGGEAAPDGSTLKVSAPAPQSPVNNAQPATMTFVAATSTPLFAVASTPAMTYEFQVLTSGGTVVNGCTTIVNPSGSTVSASPACTIDFDTNYRWRVRARIGAAAGPWGEATFRSPIGGYINGNEVYDPLYTGASVGSATGVSYTPQGARFAGHDSHIEYRLDPNLQAGEISVMVTGIDEGNPGDKTKIFSMQEGNGNDLTDNDYRMTVEKRGRDYVVPGATTWRIITGEADDHDRIIDGDRLPVAFSDELWYFWKFTWGNGRAALEVRENGPNGPVIYYSTRGMGDFPYRPLPHYAYLGGKVGRNGPIDASIPGAIYKNLWISSRPRPAFPNE